MISFRDNEIESIAALRGGNSSPSLVARKDLERYYILLQDAEAHLPFGLSEIKCLYDICNGTMFEPCMLDPGIRFSVEDAESAYFEKWGVSQQLLVDKLRALSALSLWALVTKIERYWSDNADK